MDEARGEEAAESDRQQECILRGGCMDYPHRHPVKVSTSYLIGSLAVSSYC